jgi:hypothetical protein
MGLYVTTRVWPIVAARMRDPDVPGRHIPAQMLSPSHVEVSTSE